MTAEALHHAAGHALGYARVTTARETLVAFVCEQSVGGVPFLLCEIFNVAGIMVRQRLVAVSEVRTIDLMEEATALRLGEPLKPSLARIAAEVEDQFDISLGSRLRRAEYAEARFAFYWLTRRFEIAGTVAARFLKQDHGTAFHGARRCGEIMVFDQDYAARVRAIEAILLTGTEPSGTNT